jgi:hypothetical protein
MTEVRLSRAVDAELAPPLFCVPWGGSSLESWKKFQPSTTKQGRHRARQTLSLPGGRCLNGVRLGRQAARNARQRAGAAELWGTNSQGRAPAETREGKTTGIPPRTFNYVVPAVEPRCSSCTRSAESILPRWPSGLFVSKLPGFTIPEGEGKCCQSPWPSRCFPLRLADFLVQAAAPGESVRLGLAFCPARPSQWRLLPFLCAVAQRHIRPQRRQARGTCEGNS